jgi:hypothetical protein
MGKIIEVRDVVALKFEPSAVTIVCLKDVFYILERVSENQIAGSFKMCVFPFKLELFVLGQEWEEGEVH